MNPEVTRQDVQVVLKTEDGETTQVSEQTATIVLEEEKSIWQQSGFLDDLARVCDNLENLPEGHFLPRDLQLMIEKVAGAVKVEDFNDCTDQDIQEHINTLRHELPRYYNDVIATIRDVGRARPIVVDDDFI